MRSNQKKRNSILSEVRESALDPVEIGLILAYEWLRGWLFFFFCFVFLVNQSQSEVK